MIAISACDVLVKVKQSPLSASRSLTSPPKNARGSLGAPLTTNNRNIYFFLSSTASPLPSHTPNCLFQLRTTSTMSAPPSPSPAGNQDDAPQQSEHLNIKVTDNNNEVFFKIKRTTQLKKLMDAFCERQGKSFTSVRFLFDGTRVNPTDNPEMLEMQDGDTLEVHQEQIGGGC
ncbi:hypothetical protein Q7P35_010073 [Cladosporium inversicolor]